MKKSAAVLGTMLLLGASGSLVTDVFFDPAPDTSRIQADMQTFEAELVDVRPAMSLNSGVTLYDPETKQQTKIDADSRCIDLPDDSEIGQTFTITMMGDEGSPILGECSPAQLIKIVDEYREDNQVLGQFGLRVGFVGMLLGAVATFGRGSRNEISSSPTAIVTSGEPPAPGVLKSDVPQKAVEPAPAHRPLHVVQAGERAQALDRRGRELQSSARAQLLGTWEQVTLAALLDHELPKTLRLYRLAVDGVSEAELLRSAQMELDGQLGHINEEISRLNRTAHQKILEQQRTHGIFLADKFEKSELDLSEN